MYSAFEYSFIVLALYKFIIIIIIINLHNVCFQFLLGITVVPRELKTMLMKFFFFGGGPGAGGETRCIMGDVKMELRELCVN